MGDETRAQQASRIADNTAEILKDIFQVGLPHIEAPLDLAVRMAVLRAFGCACTPGRAMAVAQGQLDPPATYFEDITCILHGLGPVVGDVRNLRDDPGA